ncbi:alpha-amylase [Paraphaeosphaeria sporulosa]|uniref:alpha-amylase n=1 Tax=Paraphaeosphaeria sporulosa TaxID=1460663 RepID=A0A177CX32_9PLEO|nr:alpha-amylase [Paraphaeosphaeria sporulosa]OAG11761.1 alpha-amylase [Paraphaeosphaeria sporulosa]
MRFFITAAVASLLQTCFAATATDWRSRSIYQVFTDRFARTDGNTAAPCNVANNLYCGGTWKGLEKKLDYIKNMGFTAVWISPITAQVANAYHGYYQNDLYSLNTHFGTARDLRSLASALHSKGMYLMVDIVPNHMAFASCPDKVDFRRLKTFNHPDKFHSYCPIKNTGNQTELEDCWLGDCNMALPDIKTDDPLVAREMNAWIRWLVSAHNVDGLRIDSVKNVNKAFFPPFCRAAGVFCMGEVSEGHANYTYPYQKQMDSVLDYPLYYSITRVFQQKSNMSDLVVALASCTDNQETGCKDPTLLGAFFENHDNPRFANVTQDLSLVKNALTFTMLGDGIPIVYQGQEQNFAGGDDPWCREALWSSQFNTTSPLYKHTALLNNIRNHIVSESAPYLSYQTRILAYTATEMQLRKGAIRTVLSNQGEHAPTWALKTQGMEFEKGKTVFDVLSCARYGVDGNGEVDVNMRSGEPVVLVEENVLRGSDLCTCERGRGSPRYRTVCGGERGTHDL